MTQGRITIEALDSSTLRGHVLCYGSAPDDVTGLNMTGSGKTLHWVAKRGAIGDWCVYCHWSSHDFVYILSQGDKVINRENIENILDIDDEVWARYRF
ncbi:hypothetical protein LCGC14_1995000 [marine sediment metagenome]|uniref:Uncharacterized protein n=1 Tax=marine sediment metagenome TaxID=412755 RepID=A0A0F9F4S1_9ZZZZ